MLFRSSPASTSSAAAALGLDPLPGYRPAREGPDGDAELHRRFPLQLLTPKTHPGFLNSSYSHLPKHGLLEGGPTLEMHGDDLRARGLDDGDRVRVWNDRGSVEVTVRNSARVRAGVVATGFGWWSAHEPHGCWANSLTSDELADWGGGVAFHDTLVQVSRLG